jgi:NADH-quinone oxidoreductase subunit E
MEKEQYPLLRETLEQYRDKEGSLITVLQKAQALYGYLAEDLLLLIAEALHMQPAHVLGVATFYTQFRLNPVGKNIILLCQGTACHVNGSADILAAICDELNIAEGETTADGLFTLESVACLGCCSLSPVMMINGAAYGSLTPDAARKIIHTIRKEAVA